MDDELYFSIEVGPVNLNIKRELVVVYSSCSTLTRITRPFFF